MYFHCIWKERRWYKEDIRKCSYLCTLLYAIILFSYWNIFFYTSDMHTDWDIRKISYMSQNYECPPLCKQWCHCRGLKTMDRLITHITAIQTLHPIYTSQTLQIIQLSEWLITHMNEIWALKLHFQWQLLITVITESFITQVKVIWLSWYCFHIFF